jgi:hypothetical protein
MALRKVNLDENPIGEQGARAVMNVPAKCGPRLDISAARCNTVLRYEKCWFDVKHPCRSYALDVSVPYERAVVFKLLHIVVKHPTIVFSQAA